MIQRETMIFSIGRGRTVLAALAFLLVPVFARGASQEVFEQNVPAAGIRTVYVGNVNGDVVVSAGPGDSVQIHAEKSARGGRADEWLKKLEIKVKTEGGRLSIETIHPKRKKLLGLFEVENSSCCTVRYAIRVPADRGVEVETVNGSIDISSLGASIRAETVNGSIALSGVRGQVDASTVNGSVAVTRVGGNAPVRLETVNGNVEIALERSAGFSYELETVNGRIESDFPLSVEGKFGPKSARGTVGSGETQLAAESVNGSIRLRGK
jgi:hypothetical protein